MGVTMGADDHPTVTPGEADSEGSDDPDDEAEDDGGEA